MVVNPGPPPAALPITRVEWTSDQKPPWSGLKFTLPVGSDALSDALRSRYRDGADLRERKHMAAIDFLTAELRLMRSAQASRAPSDVDDSTASETPTQRSVMVRSHSQQHSDFSSSNVVGYDRTSLRPAYTTQPDASTIGAPTPVSVSGQQIVFSVTDGRPQRLRTKRPMTKREKAAYKKTRERGACPPCRKQKAKCTHVDHTESEGLEQIARLQPGKRQRSHDASLDQAEVRKLQKTLSPASDPRPDCSLSPSPQAFRSGSQYSTPDLTEHSEANLRFDGSAGWMPMADQGSQVETPRYVPPVFDPYGVPVPQHALYSWSGSTSIPGMDTCIPGYGPLHAHNIPDNPPQGLGPMESIPGLDQYSPPLPLFNHGMWSDQECRPTSSDPG